MGLGNSTQLDVLELTRYTDNPFTPGSLDRYIAAVNNTLVYWDGTSWTVLGAGGGGATWETLYSADNTFNITGGNGFTIADTSASANPTLALTRDAGSSGAVLTFTNSGSGVDVLGTSSTWQVTKTGVATLAGVSISGTASAIATSGAAVWTILDNSATSLRIGPSGGPVFLTFDTTNSAEVLSTDALTFQVTSGKTNLINASNTISTLVATNNTITTFGADANSAGMVVFRSTSLTTGALLQLQLTEGTLNGGFYLVARDVTGSANVFTLGEDGAVVIAGNEGNNVLTVTAGDVVVSDGSLAITDDDNAASFSVTNNTATTASVVAIAGSGTFTGSTTSSFMTITPSGLTTGTAVYLIATALTTGIALDISTDSLTTGKVIDMSDLAAITTGKAIHVDATGVTQTDGILVHLDSASTALTSTGRILLVDHTGNATVSGVIAEFASAAADETTIVKITASAALAAGTALDISAAALTTGKVIDMSDLGAITTGKAIHIDATGVTQTSGILVHIDSASTALTGAGRLLLVDHTGASASSAVVAEIASAAADETVVFRVTASAALAAGVLVDLSAAALTTGTVLDMGGLDALTTGTALNVVSDSTSNGTRSLVRIVNDNTGATGTTPLYIQQDAVTSTNFKKLITLGTFTIWTSDETSPNTALSGTKGDICLNGSATGQAYWCTGTTNWTALA